MEQKPNKSEPIFHTDDYSDYEETIREDKIKQSKDNINNVCEKDK